MTDERSLWNALGERLSRLGETGGADFWMRDDDAVEPSAALDRLIAIADATGVPLQLAVIPAFATEALAERLARLPTVTVLQHGFSHEDHAAPGAKRCELSDARPADVTLAELASGAERLAMFARVAPILVPPWNRIAGGVSARLPELGFSGLSLYGDRRDAPQGLVLLNTHWDPVDWHGGRGFLGREAVLALLIARLDRLISGIADRNEPTGLLTHHLVHNAATFDFLAELLDFMSSHAFCRWHSAESLLGLGKRSEGSKVSMIDKVSSDKAPLGAEATSARVKS